MQLDATFSVWGVHLTPLSVRENHLLHGLALLFGSGQLDGHQTLVAEANNAIVIGGPLLDRVYDEMMAVWADGAGPWPTVERLLKKEPLEPWMVVLPATVAH